MSSGEYIFSRRVKIRFMNTGMGGVRQLGLAMSMSSISNIPEVAKWNELSYVITHLSAFWDKEAVLSTAPTYGPAVQNRI